MAQWRYGYNLLVVHTICDSTGTEMYCSGDFKDYFNFPLQSVLPLYVFSFFSLSLFSSSLFPSPFFGFFGLSVFRAVCLAVCLAVFREQPQNILCGFVDFYKVITECS